uniref:Putative zinc-finger domain-containing protein n=1 Tax=Acrobeloides nanus TaxID=290746 RepID=A0A914DQ80_9BILA
MDTSSKNLEDGEINSCDDFDLAILDNEDDVDRIIAEIKQSVLNNKDVDWRIPSLDEEMRKMKESGAFPGPSSTKKQKEDGEISSDEGPLKNDVRVMDKSPLRTTHAQFQKSPSRKLDGSSSSSRYRHRYRTRKRFHNEIDHNFVVSPRHSAFSPLPPPPLPPLLNETESTHSSISAGLIESRTTESVSWRKPQFIFSQKDTLYEPASSTKMENLCDNFEEINMEISNSGNSDVDEPNLPLPNIFNKDISNEQQVDEAEALRALLLSQVKRKQAEKNAQKPSSSMSRGEIPNVSEATTLTTEKQLIQSPESPPEHESNGSESPDQDTQEFQSEVDGHDEYQLDFVRIEETITDQLNDVEDLRRKLDFHRKKYDTNFKRKTRLQENIRLCDKAMDEHHGEILRLSQKIARMSRDLLQERKSELNKAEKFQDRMKKRLENLKLQNVRKMDSKQAKTLIIPLETQKNFLNDSLTEQLYSSKSSVGTNHQSSSLVNERTEPHSTLMEKEVVTSKTLSEPNVITNISTETNVPEMNSGRQKPVVSDNSSVSTKSNAFNHIAMHLDLGQYTNGETQQAEEIEANLLHRIMSRNRLRKDAVLNNNMSQVLDEARFEPNVELSNNIQEKSNKRLKNTQHLSADQIRYSSICRRLNSFLPLCYYQLNGRCADHTCPWQHERDYLLSDQEILRGILQLSLSKCPNNLTHAEFAAKLLDEDTLENIIDNLFEKIPDLSERIEYFLDSLQPIRKPIPTAADDAIRYEIPERLKNNL